MAVNKSQEHPYISLTGGSASFEADYSIHRTPFISPENEDWRHSVIFDGKGLPWLSEIVEVLWRLRFPLSPLKTSPDRQKKKRSRIIMCNDDPVMHVFHVYECIQYLHRLIHM